MSDNGIGLDFVVVGTSRSALEDKHGLVLFIVCTELGNSDRAYRAGVEGVPGLFLIMVDDIVRGVAVAERGLKSIAGGLQVGDPIENVLASYQSRIEANPGSVSFGCAANLFVAWQRAEYRLVFRHDGTTVTSILGVATENVPDLDLQCGEAPPPRDNESLDVGGEIGGDDDEVATVRVIDSFVPASLAGANLLVQDVSSDRITDEATALLWWGVSVYALPDYISIADSALSCLYEQDVVTVGLYGSPASMVVAYERDAVDLTQAVGCTVVDFYKDLVCPPSRLCSTSGPAGGVYEAEIDGQTFIVVYATLDGPDHADAMCIELPECPSLTVLFEQPVIDIEIPVLIPVED